MAPQENGSSWLKEASNAFCQMMEALTPLAEVIFKRGPKMIMAIATAICLVYATVTGKPRIPPEVWTLISESLLK